MLRSILLVEPDNGAASILAANGRSVADVHWHAGFETARVQLLTTPFDFIVTNLRLKAYNGLHLVHLAATAELPARAIVYTDQHDAALAREVQRAGAFYETHACLIHALAAYLEGTLPRRDRRDPAHRNRRTLFRGGRRCWDQQLLHGGAERITNH